MDGDLLGRVEGGPLGRVEAVLRRVAARATERASMLVCHGPASLSDERLRASEQSYPASPPPALRYMIVPSVLCIHQVATGSRLVSPFPQECLEGSLRLQVPAVFPCLVGCPS